MDKLKKKIFLKKNFISLIQFSLPTVQIPILLLPTDIFKSSYITHMTSSLPTTRNPYLTFQQLLHPSTN